MNTTRTALAIGLAAICTAGLAARTQNTQTTRTTKTTTVEVKGGTDVTVTGCLEKRPSGDYILTTARANPQVEPARYALVSSEDLPKHVGTRVEIQGKAVPSGTGKVTVDTKTRTEVDNGKDQESRTKTAGTGSTLDIPTLGVSSMKTLAQGCF